MAVAGEARRRLHHRRDNPNGGRGPSQRAAPDTAGRDEDAPPEPPPPPGRSGTTGPGVSAEPPRGHNGNPSDDLSLDTLLDEPPDPGRSANPDMGYRPPAQPNGSWRCSA